MHIAQPSAPSLRVMHITGIREEGPLPPAG